MSENKDHLGKALGDALLYIGGCALVIVTAPVLAALVSFAALTFAAVLTVAAICDIVAAPFRWFFT